MSIPPHHVVLLGPPGAGKGTIGHRLAAAFTLGYTSTGDIVRADPQQGPLVRHGNLSPSDLINAIMAREITGQPASRVWDGNLRLAPQVAAFLALLHQHGHRLRLVIDLQLPDFTTAWARVTRRAHDDAQAGRDVRREDTDQTAFRRRWHNLAASHPAVMAELHARVPGQVVTLDATAAPDAVYAQVVAAYQVRRA